VVKIEMTPRELNVALQMRRNITRVCKTWYAMGIEILYSHIRIIPFIWDGPATQQLVDSPQLLSHTKRLTIVSYDHIYVPRLIQSVAGLTWTARLCASLPQLRILDAPGDILLSLPNQRLPSSLAVAMFRGRRGLFTVTSSRFNPLHGPWCNIRVLRFDLHSLDLDNRQLLHHLGEMNFASVEELYFNEGHERDEKMSDDAVEDVTARWKLPKLHTLSIRCFDWPRWYGFLEAHAQTLKILSLTTYNDISFLQVDMEEINFPALEGLHLDCYHFYHTIVAGKVTQVGLHGLGCDGYPGRTTTKYDKSENLLQLLRAFNYWLHFPTATTYCISGLHEVLEWLEEQPRVIKCVAERGACGVDVQFIHMDEY
jgi:hypothetical protein